MYKEKWFAKIEIMLFFFVSRQFISFRFFDRSWIWVV